MVSKSGDASRRILSFPVVRPGDSVSLPVLLASLISLARTICAYKSKAFYSSKRTARKTIRLIECLVILLEEMRKGRSSNEDSTILALSELHCVFQKVEFLLGDCARDDARLLMLAKSERVSGYFVEAARAIAVAMDVIPLEGFNVEVKELAEFVGKQAGKAEAEVERDDKIHAKIILGVLRQFEHAAAPESGDLKRVLEYLEIRSWSDCQKEAKFLESEIGKDCSTAEKRDVGFLSSLTAFLIYCRCNLFATMDCVVNDPPQRDGGRGTAPIGPLNPDDFKCPITLETMADPVTISSGHTYDRSSILKWFRSGNYTCPKTGERLVCTDVVPNVSLRRLIKGYCHENGIRFLDSDRSNRDGAKSPLTGAGSPAAAQAMTLLARFLAGRLLVGPIQEQQKNVHEIRLLTRSSIFNRSCFVKDDATIPCLLRLLSSDDQEVQENAMAALLNLSKHPKTKQIIFEYGGFNPVVSVFKGGLKMEARQHAAGALFYLSSVEDYRRKIGEIPGSVSGLVYLLRNGSDRAKKNALLTTMQLLKSPDIHPKFLESAVVPPLINILTSSDREELVADSLAVLAALAEKPDGSAAIARAESVPAILEVLDSSYSRSAKEYTVSLLLSLCINSWGDVLPFLADNPSLIVSLYSVLTHGTPRSSKKAGSLIRILQTFNRRSPSSSMASALPQDQLVRVR